MNLTVNRSLQGNHGHPYLPYISKNKQLMDTQIGVNAIQSRGGRYVSPIYQTVSCLLHKETQTHASYKCWVSRCAHKFAVQKMDGGAGKMVEDSSTMPTKHDYIKIITEHFFKIVLRFSFSFCRHHSHFSMCTKGLALIQKTLIISYEHFRLAILLLLLMILLIQVDSSIFFVNFNLKLTMIPI